MLHGRVGYASAGTHQPASDLKPRCTETDVERRCAGLNGDVVRDVEGKGGLANAGSRAEQRELASVEPAGQNVELWKAGGQSGRRATFDLAR